MTDSTLNCFLASGTAAERLAFTPDPPTPASGPDPTYLWAETDTGNAYVWDYGGAVWFKVLSVPQIQTVTSAATVTPTFADDAVHITAQAAALTLANPTGTAVDGHGIVIRIKDNGTARAITFGAQYRAIDVTLPTTTVLGKTLYLGGLWNAADTKFDVLVVKQQA